MIQIIIPGAPIPQQRPRIGKRGAYNPQASEKRAVQIMITQQIKKIVQSKEGARQARLLASCRHFDITMYFVSTPPLSWPQNRQKQAIQGKWPNNTKPDIDNLIKFALDTANGILFEDDRQITCLTAQKMYGEIDQTIIQIRGIL